MQKLRVGIVGCGNIAPAYFKGCTMFRALEAVACADLNMDSAKARAEEYKVKALTVDELLASPDVDLVVNLTIPKAHAAISRRALLAGKHVHSEKPLGITLEEGADLVALAAKLKLRLGCAPDTFLGAGLQTCRKVITDGWLGRPVAGTAFMMGRGPEGWHPNPAFFYERGGGPMLDMGPYYITALVHLLGPIKAVSAVAVKSFPERIATCAQHFGEKLPVEVPTHNSGTLIFESGAVVTVCISFDIHAHTHSPIEIYGTEGSMQVPDPNGFGGDVKVFRPDGGQWQSFGFSHPYKDNSRSIGAADMAHAVRSGRPHRCNGELALHVLEVMLAFEKASQDGRTLAITNRCTQPAPLPLGMLPGVLDN